MAEKTIMLVCAAGMSTSMLVKKMQDAAQEKQIKVKIFATAASNAENEFASEHPDLLLLGPQVRYMESDMQAKFSSIPVKVIDMADYGMMNGKGVLEKALKLI
jgi:PTS system cellobiose-specific IIB component